MIGQLGQELHKAQTRILDHRAFVNGEIDTFLNNFELQRNDIEVERLFQVTETVGNLKYQLNERCYQQAQKNLDDIDKSLKELVEGVEWFVEEKQKEQPVSDKLIKSREARAARRENIIKDFEHKQQRLANSFEEKEEEIAELYAGLQLKLNISN